MEIKFFDILKCGNLEMSSFAVIDGKRVYSENMSLVSATAENMQIRCTYPDGGSEDFYFVLNPDKSSFNCRRVFTNGKKDIKLNELGLAFNGIDFGGQPKNDYFYHNENPRIYECFTFPLDYNRTAADAQDSEFDVVAGNRWADPGVVNERIGRSPYQPFPAIHLGNYDKTSGVVHGTLSQKIFYHNYLVGHDAKGAFLETLSSFKAQEYLDIQAGRTLVDEWYFGVAAHADDIDRVFEEYVVELRKKLPANYGATAINRDNMVWGSWNDGIFFNVTEDMILREAAYLKENFPTVRWIQLDDGYSTVRYSAHGLGVPFEGEEGFDRVKFPDGMRGYTDKIRALGLRPAIWIGGFCNHKNKIYKERPEWFCDYSFRCKDVSPLDISQKVVRDYVRYALDVLITECGFDGVKHDFWSYAFEDSNPLLSVHDKSGYEYRTWWLREMRARIASDGYLQTGCDIVQGNPFLGEYFTNYRYGIDVGDGNWDFVKTNFQWGVACFATHTGDLFVPNSDSVGLFKSLTETDMLFLLNYIVLTRTMVEIAGKLSYDPDHPRMKYLRKAACCVNNGQDVYCAKFDYRKTGRQVPLIMYLRSAQFSAIEDAPCMPLRTVGLFNSEEDTDLNVSFNAADIKLDASAKYRVFDVWTHQEYTADAAGSCNFNLAPHQSIMLAVVEDTPVCLIDADVKVISAERNADTMVLSFDYAKAGARLFFAGKVKSVTIDGKEAAFTVDGGEIVLDVPEKSAVTFAF